MIDLPIILLILLGIGTILTGLLALTLYRDPVTGMEEATHRPEQLPLVMIDRYIAITVIQAGLFLFGSLEMVAVFCVAGIIMGFGDGPIYKRAGYPHIKHTASGCIGLVGLIFTLYYIAQNGAVGL